MTLYGYKFNEACIIPGDILCFLFIRVFKQNLQLGMNMRFQNLLVQFMLSGY